jgi:hypothetical protein
MPEIEEIKNDLLANVETELDAWETFYKKYKDDYAKIDEYQKKIEKLQEEIEVRDNLLKHKLKKERGTLFLSTIAFVVVAVLFMELISKSVNFWLYFAGGFMIGLGAFSLFYLWIR